MDIDWDNIDCYVCCNHCDTLEFGAAPITATYIFAIRIHETIRLLEFDFTIGEEITLDADLLNEDSVSQITVYYMVGDEGIIVHQCNINVSISSSVPNPCPLPPFDPICPDCGDADYELTIDGGVVGIGAIPCNETTAIPIDDLCPVSGDATVENSNQSFQEPIPCGDVYVLEDYEFEFQDENFNITATEIRPAMIGETFIVQSYCPTQFSYNLNINGVFSQVVTVDINSDINITLL